MLKVTSQSPPKTKAPIPQLPGGLVCDSSQQKPPLQGAATAHTCAYMHTHRREPILSDWSTLCAKASSQESSCGVLPSAEHPSAEAPL